MTSIALSELTGKPSGRVTSGIREPRLTPGPAKDTHSYRKHQMSSTGGRARGEKKGRGLHGVAVPGAAAALKEGTSLPSGELIG